jgi:hypothetical protein
MGSNIMTALCPVVPTQPSINGTPAAPANARPTVSRGSGFSKEGHSPHVRNCARHVARPLVAINAIFDACSDTVRRDYSSAVDELRAAIRKATGETGLT